MPVTLILSVGFDPCRLLRRNHLLRSAGYTIETASGMRDAVSRFLSGDYDLVLLCHSIPEKERGLFIALIRASGSKTPVVSVAEESGASSDTSVDAVLADEKASLLAGLSSILTTAATRWNAARLSLHHETAHLLKRSPGRIVRHEEHPHLERKTA